MDSNARLGAYPPRHGSEEHVESIGVLEHESLRLVDNHVHVE